MRGIIDIGSNTMRLSFYQTEGETFKLLFSKKSMAGLAAHIDECNNLTKAGIKNAINVLLEFKTLLNNLSNPPVDVIATASLRNVNNTQEAIAAIDKATGFNIILLSGTEEAHYDSQAVRLGMRLDKVKKADNFVVVDIGGGSTEMVICDHGKTVDECSFPVGSLNQFMRHVDYLIPTKDNRKVIEENIKGHMHNRWKKGVPQIPLIAGVGGSVRTALKLYSKHYNLDADNGVMEMKRIKKLIKEFSPTGKESVIKLTKIAPERIHTLIPGMIILHTVADVVGAQTIAVSNWGVREGYLIHLLEQAKSHA